MLKETSHTITRSNPPLVHFPKLQDQFKELPEILQHNRTYWQNQKRKQSQKKGGYSPNTRYSTPCFPIDEISTSSSEVNKVCFFTPSFFFRAKCLHQHPDGMRCVVFFYKWGVSPVCGRPCVNGGGGRLFKRVSCLLEL